MHLLLAILGLLLPSALAATGGWTNGNVARKIDLNGATARVSTTVTATNGGSSPLSSYTFLAAADSKSVLAYIEASQNGESIKVVTGSNDERYARVPRPRAACCACARARPPAIGLATRPFSARRAR